MKQKLTQSTVASIQALGDTRLTSKDNAYFKLLFSDQILRQYRFNHLHNPPLRARYDQSEYTKVLHSLGKFIDDTVCLTITEVEEKYRRPPFRSDIVTDPVTNLPVKVEHLALFDKNAGMPPVIPSDSIRLHGYYRGEYFVLIRLDWFHTFRT